MKDMHDFKSQSRWNDVYGRQKLKMIKDNPEAFIVDIKKIQKPKSDLFDAMFDKKDKKILEFGSGRGEFSVALAKSGANVTGIDIGHDLVSFSRTVAKINKVKCDFVVGSVDKLQFDNNSFDFVVGNGILHHLSRKGVKDALAEAYRVLKPGGMALFTEPIENSNLFNFIQNVFPVGKPHSDQYRPSIFQRKKWKQYLVKADDRPLSNKEFTDAKGLFREVKFRYYGLLRRLERLFPWAQCQKLFASIDLFLTHTHSPIKRLSQAVLVTFRK